MNTMNRCLNASFGSLITDYEATMSKSWFNGLATELVQGVTSPAKREKTVRHLAFDAIIAARVIIANSSFQGPSTLDTKGRRFPTQVPAECFGVRSFSSLCDTNMTKPKPLHCTYLAYAASSSQQRLILCITSSWNAGGLLLLTGNGWWLYSTLTSPEC